MFREMILHWARIFDLFVGVMSTMAVLTRARPVFGRPWESMANARYFDRELVTRKAHNEWQSRMPVAR